MSSRPNGHGTYCPVSLAAETVGERWTIPLLLALIDGYSRFNELRRAMPRISPSTLSQRLQHLEDAGVVARSGSRDGGHRYDLTEAGHELEPIVRALGAWGQRWARDLAPEDLDTRSLGWSIHRRMDTDAMPPGRTVIEFDLDGEAAYSAPFWIVHEDGKVDVCIRHPGCDADLTVRAELRRFVEVWRGFRSLEQEIARRRIRVQGPRELRRAFPRWLLLSELAGVERRRPGTERRVYLRSAAR